MQHRRVISVVIIIGMLIYTSIGFSFHDAAGRFVPPSYLKDKWIVVNYWADWCDSCLEEVQELNNFYKNNQGNNVVIFGVNYDGLEKHALKQAIQKAGILFPVFQEDPAQQWRLGDITVLPTTFIINPDGDVVQKIIGPNTEQSLLKIVQNKLYGKRSIKEKKNLLV